MPTRQKSGSHKRASTGGTSARHADGIAPARGKLGVMMPGMGAVATTFVAGVEAIRKGIAAPIGSRAPLGTISLGRGPAGRSAGHRALPALAGPTDAVF